MKKIRQMEQVEAVQKPDHILSYFRSELPVLLIITVTGIIYNVGMTAGPYFEGQLVQGLFDVTEGNKTIKSMGYLCLTYLVVIMLVQGMRAIKRFYVRRFANNINKNMRHMVYNSLVFSDRTGFDADSTGVMMTKAVSDVNACAEGMRKFTTEVFDTGVVLIAYLVMLFLYDARLALISCIFPPIAYVFAEKLKTVVYRYNKAFKKETETLMNLTTDRVSGAMLYRIFGREQDKNRQYEEELKRYEKAAVKANVWENTMAPIYLVLSSISVIFILYFGSKNVCHTGWTEWNIADFTTFLACFTKLATKSSKAAKLFNAVQKANVSWKRIKPLMKEYQELYGDEKDVKVSDLSVCDLHFSYPDGEEILSGLSFTAKQGELIGVTGPVAGGKSTFGKTFLCEYPYEGSIRMDGKELGHMSERERNCRVAYLGHQPELISTSVRENISLGDTIDTEKWLRFVCLFDEVDRMEDAQDTLVGNGGTQLSGGQQARLALARTLAHAKPVIVLDDPFSALDKETEKQILENIKKDFSDCIVILISHRLEMFHETSQVIWIDHGKCLTGTHESFLKENREYQNLFHLQKGGKDYDEK